MQVAYENEAGDIYLQSMDEAEIAKAAQKDTCLAEVLTLATPDQLKKKFKPLALLLQKNEGQFSFVFNVHERNGLQLFARREANVVLGFEKIEFIEPMKPSKQCAKDAEEGIASLLASSPLGSATPANPGEALGSLLEPFFQEEKIEEQDFLNCEIELQGMGIFRSDLW